MALLGGISRFLDKYLFGYALGVASGQALAPIVQPLANEANATVQAMPLSAAEAAAAWQQGYMEQPDANTEAAQTGYNSTRANILRELAGNPPGPETLLQMLNRGVIGELTFRQAIREGLTKTKYTDDILALRYQLISAVTLAEMVVQGVLDQPTARADAAKAGIAGADFDRLVELSGNPPGGMEMLDLWNRGEATEAEVDRALKQSRLKPEWVDTVKQLRHVLPSVSDLVRFAVREVYTPATRSRFGLDQDFPPEFATESAKRGLSAESAKQYWAAHWELPSAQQGYAMLHRGLATEADIELLLKSLDVMPFWRDKLLQLAHIVPGRIDLRRMFNANVLTEAEVYAGYIKLGYTDADARSLTDLAVSLKVGGSGDKELAKAEILALYEGRIASETEARTALAKLGYSPDEVSALLSLSEARRIRRFLEAAINKIHTLYVSYRIERQEATTQLDALGISSDARDDMLELWSVERATNVRDLSAAQILGAAAIPVAGTDWNWALARLQQIGYAEADARILVNLKAKSSVV